MAEITKIEIYNLFSYGDDYNIVDFEKLDGLNCIIGSNGAGKSSIFECIEFAFYGYTNRWGKTNFDDIVRYGEDSGHVKLWFRINNTLYTITRGFKKKRPFVKLINEDLPNDHQERNLTCRKLVDNDLCIRELIGMDLQTFSSSIMFSQGDVSLFVSGTSASRQLVLRNVLGLSLIDRLLRQVKIKLEVVVKEEARLDAQIDLLSENNSVALLEELIEKASTIQDNINLVVSKKKANEEILGSIAKQISDILKIKDEIQSLHQELTQKNSEYTKNKSKYDNIFNPLKIRREQVVKEIKVVKTSFNLQYSDDSEIKTALESEIIKIASKIDDLQVDEDSRKDIEQSVRISIRELGEEMAKMNAEIASIESAGIEGKKNKEKIAKWSVCSECGQSIPGELIEAEIQKVENKLVPLRQKHIKLSECLHVKQEEYNAKVKHLAELEVQRRTNQNSILEAKRLEIDLSSAKENKDKFVKLLEEREALMIKINEVKSTLGARNFEIEAEIGDVERRIHEAKSKLPDNYNELLEHERTYMTLVDKDNKLVSKLEQESAVINDKIESMAINVAKIDDMKDKLSREKVQSDILRKLEVVYGNKGLRVRLIQEELPELEEIMNNHIAAITDDKAQVQFLINNENESFEMLIHFEGRTFSFRSLSGGERKRVLIAGCLALGEFVVSRMANHWNILCFDEIFADLDDSGRKKLLALLQGINAIVPKIIVITHLEDVRDLISQQIIIEKHNGISKILQKDFSQVQN